MPKNIWSISKRRAKIKPEIYKTTPVVDAEEIGLVQGVTPGSKEEWRIAQALYILGHIFIYQYPVMGGRMVGGQIIDFWVTDTMLPTPVYMNGRAWHNNKNAAVDDYKMSKLMRIYYGRIRKPVLVYDENVPSINMAVSFLRSNL